MKCYQEHIRNIETNGWSLYTDNSHNTCTYTFTTVWRKNGDIYKLFYTNSFNKQNKWTLFGCYP